MKNRIFPVIFLLLMLVNCNSKLENINEQKTTLKLELEKLQRSSFSTYKNDRPAYDTLNFKSFLQLIYAGKYSYLENDFNKDGKNDILYVVPASSCMGKGTSDEATLIYSKQNNFIKESDFSKKIEKEIEKLLIEKGIKTKRILVRFRSFETYNFSDRFLGHFFGEFENKNYIMGDFEYLTKNENVKIKLKKS